MKAKVHVISEKIVLGFHIYSDVILGIFLTVFSTSMFLETYSIKIMKEPVSPVDTARFFPRLVFGALMIIGLAMAILGLRQIAANKASVPKGEKLAASVLALERGVIAVASIALFILLMEPMGFIPTAILYMAGSMFFMAAKEVWKPKAYIITAVMIAVACYFLFREFVYVQLPAGLLKGVL